MSEKNEGEILYKIKRIDDWRGSPEGDYYSASCFFVGDVHVYQCKVGIKKGPRSWEWYFTDHNDEDEASGWAHSLPEAQACAEEAYRKYLEERILITVVSDKVDNFDRNKAT